MFKPDECDDDDHPSSPSWSDGDGVQRLGQLQALTYSEMFRAAVRLSL